MLSEIPWIPDPNDPRFPRLGEMDDLRVWKITLHFEDGSVINYKDEHAFWGSGKNAKAVAEFTADCFNRKGRKVLRWETERDEDG